MAKFEVKIEFVDKFGEKIFKNFKTLDNFFKQTRKGKYELDLFLDKVVVDYQKKQSTFKDITIKDLIQNIEEKGSLL